MRLLVIEDDRAAAEYVAGGLREDGHVVDVAGDGRRGLALAVAEPYDVVVTDRMLPGVDGVQLVRALRAAGVGTPVLMLTALSEVDRRVEGLEAGADDYLAKPFAFAELRARIRALARRPASAAPAGGAAHGGGGSISGGPTELRVGELRMDLLRRTAFRGGRALELLPTEWRLLEYLMRHPGQVVTRTMLLEKVWDFSFDPATNVVDVHVSRLRRKLDLPGEAPMLRTVRGAGYALDAAPAGSETPAPPTATPGTAQGPG